MLLNKGLSHLPLNWGEWPSSNPARCLGGLVAHPQYEISNDPPMIKAVPLTMTQSWLWDGQIRDIFFKKCLARNCCKSKTITSK